MSNIKTHTVQVDVIGSLNSTRSSNMPLVGALFELIDNSYDEGATEIIIREDIGALIIEDNGAGFKDITSALIFGKSSKSGKIGRYGVGMKQACVRYSDTTIIESNGKRFTSPWLKIIMENDPSLIEELDIEHEEITRITLLNFRSIYRSAIKTNQIARTYQKLIESKKLRIEIMGTALVPVPQPVYTHTVTKHFDYDGKKIILTGGIYKSSDPARSEWKGYNPYYNGRLIGKGNITNHGTGDEGCTSFCFIVELIDGEKAWGLATNKDDFDGIAELLEYIYSNHTQHLLELGAQQSEDIDLKKIEDAVNESLNGTSPSGNITRGPRTPTGEPKKETSQGSPKRNTNTATESGNYNNGFGSMLSKSIKAKFRFEELDGLAFGEIDVQAKKTIITANLNNQFVKANRQNKEVIILFANMLIATHRQLRLRDTAADQLVNQIMQDLGAGLSESKP